MILFGERGLRVALRQFVEHCHSERNHQGLGNRLILAVPIAKESDGSGRRHERLGGLSQLLRSRGMISGEASFGQNGIHPTHQAATARERRSLKRESRDERTLARWRSGELTRHH